MLSVCICICTLYKVRRIKYRAASRPTLLPESQGNPRKHGIFFFPASCIRITSLSELYTHQPCVTPLSHQGLPAAYLTQYRSHLCQETMHVRQATMGDCERLCEPILKDSRTGVFLLRFSSDYP